MEVKLQKVVLPNNSDCERCLKLLQGGTDKPCVLHLVQSMLDLMSTIDGKEYCIAEPDYLS